MKPHLLLGLVLVFLGLMLGLFGLALANYTHGAPLTYNLQHAHVGLYRANSAGQFSPGDGLTFRQECKRFDTSVFPEREVTSMFDRLSRDVVERCDETIFTVPLGVYLTLSGLVMCVGLGVLLRGG